MCGLLVGCLGRSGRFAQRGRRWDGGTCLAAGEAADGNDHVCVFVWFGKDVMRKLLEMGKSD